MSATGTLRIVSWNLGIAFNFRKTHDRAWHDLAALDPDIALLQEVNPPSWAGSLWDIESRPARGWGSAIVAKPSLRLTLLRDETRSEPRRDPYLIPATVSLADGAELVVVSVHSRIGKAAPEDQAGFDPASIRRPHERVPHHNDVDYALIRERVQDRRFFVSGDWNTARLWDETHPGAHETDFFSRSEADA